MVKTKDEISEGTERKREQIRNYLLDGKPQNFIANHVHVSNSTISKVSKKLQKAGELSLKVGRRSKSSGKVQSSSVWSRITRFFTGE